MTQLRLTDLHTRRGRSGRPWERVKAQCFREETHCWLCGHRVDQTLLSTDPMARSADHLIQLQHEGPPLARSNLRIAHLRCNSGRSNSLRGLRREHCACSLGQPCARLTPKERTCLIVDATRV